MSEILPSSNKSLKPIENEKEIEEVKLHSVDFDIINKLKKEKEMKKLFFF